MARELLVKVCGMRDPANIEGLVKLPINYIGHIFYPKSPRYVSSIIEAEIPDRIKKTGVFVNASLDEIKEKIQAHDLKTVQLHGDESATLCKNLKELQVEVIKAFGIHDDFDWQILEDYMDIVDFFLFDSKSEDYGGTGKTFNWEKLRSYPYAKPYFLSGGLSLDNITEAINFKDQYLVGLDLNSKFEISAGLKDLDNISKALKIIENEQISSK